MNNLVFFGNGWYDIEYENNGNNGTFSWSTGNAELFFNYDFEKVILLIECPPCCAPSIVIDNGVIQEKFDVECGVNVIELDTEKVAGIKIISNTFIPSKESKNTSDSRTLGIKLCKILLVYNNKTYEVSLDKVQSKLYYDLKAISKCSYDLRQNNYSKLFSLVFDKVYCISLIGDYSRRIHAINQYKKYNINHEFISAIDPKYIGSIQTNLSKPEMSLCLTNKLCIENAKINGYNSVVIMEDDFKFNDQWLEIFYSFYRNLPDDWDFLYLGQSHVWNKISERKTTSINDYVDRIQFGCGAHFIAINSSIYDLCIGLLGELNNKADVCYWNIMKDWGNYNCYSPKISLADSMSFPDKRSNSIFKDTEITEYFPSRLSK